jgi:hypothetical protein
MLLLTCLTLTVASGFGLGCLLAAAATALADAADWCRRHGVCADLLGAPSSDGYPD